MIVPLATFVALAPGCAPSVHVETLAAVAHAESRFDSLAINDNTSGRRYRPPSLDQAVKIASALVQRRHSLDLGLMQVNSANLQRLGLNVSDAFDVCRSMAAGARVLTDFYRRQSVSGVAERALHRAVSSYNTGSAERGFTNGYVGRVQASAEIVVPAIRTRAGGEGGFATPVRPTPAAEPWDVYGGARARRDGGPRLLEGQGGPVLLKAVEGAQDAP